MFSESESREIRASFPITERACYLNSASKGALSRQVRAAVLDHLDEWDTRGAPWDIWLARVEQARARFAQMVRVSPTDLAITFCVSTAVSTVMSALDFSRRRKIVVAGNEFPTLQHIAQAQTKRGAILEVARPVEPGETLLDALRRTIDEDTLIVLAHQIHHGTGDILDIRELARSCRAQGAYLCVDAYHSAGVLDLPIRDLDLDFLITGSMKYLLGPTGGVAFLYVREALIPHLEPIFTGWFAQANPFRHADASLDFTTSAVRFESGLQPIAGVYAADAALGLLNDIGTIRLAAHAVALARAFADDARRCRLNVVTAGEPSGPSVAIRCSDPFAAARVLASQGVIAGAWGDTLRFSFHLYNTPGDVERAIDVTARILGTADAPVASPAPKGSA